MPTSCRQFGEHEQAAERVRACTHPSTVWACEAPCGWFNLLREDGKYRLTGSGLRLFGQSDAFAPDIPILGVDDADAVASTKRLILARWRHELGAMETAFGVGRPPEDRGPGLFDQSGECLATADLGGES